MKKRRPSKYILKGILLLFILIGIIFFLRSPLLAVSTIKIQGNSTLSNEQICAIADIKEPVNMFNIHTDVLQKRLEADVRIEKAIIKRVFPATVTITVEEARPVATMNCDYGYVDVSHNGKILNVYKNIKSFKYPLINGKILQDKYIGDTINDKNALKAISYLMMLKDESRVQLSEINIADPQMIVAYTISGEQIRLGTLNEAQEKAKNTEIFLHDLKKITKKIEYVDFSYTSPVFKFKS